MKKRIFAAVAALVMTVCLASCGGGAGTASGSAAAEKSELVILSWGDYIKPELIDRFKAENPDITLKYSFVSSNEEMYTIASTEGCEVDMMVPSDYTIEKMKKNDMLAEINVANISNFQYVADFAKGCTFDPESKYSVPYAAGTVGILYDKTQVTEPVTSWDILWNEKYAKKIGMYDSVRDTLAVALIRLGYDINTKNEKEVQAAADTLIAQKPLVYAYGTDDLRDIMIAGSCAMAVVYSGDAAYAMVENENLDYAIPQEGSNIWTDSFIVLKNTDNMPGCERFMNFMLDPAVSAENSEYLGYSNPSPAAIELMKDSPMIKVPGFIIPDDVRARCKYFVDIEDALTFYNDAWMRLKNA